MSCLVSAFRVGSTAVIVATGAIGCGGSPTQPSAPPTLPSSSPTPPSWDGQVQVVGSVWDFRTDRAIRGASVTIGTTTARTDATGAYSLTIPAGQQRVSIDGESIGFVRMKDRTYRGDFYVHVTGCVARYGTVVDSQSRQPVSGATVSVRGATTATDDAGWFVLSFGCPGVPCIGYNTTQVSVTHPSYVSGSFPDGRGVCFVHRVDYELMMNLRPAG
jgi:hypothetical protein